MTEQEARQKWCPFVRYIFDKELDVTTNRCANFLSPCGGALEPSNCIASDCMAWRYLYHGTGSGAVQVMVDSEGNDVTNSGYCGLAGKP